MLLTELYQKTLSAYQDLSQDNSKAELGDLRKTKLTLRQLNRMRQINDIRQYELAEKLKKIQTQYAPPAQPLV